MSDRLEQALEQELDHLLRDHDPEQPVNVDGEFVINDDEKEAAARIELLCAPPTSKAGQKRAIVSLNDQAFAFQFHKAFLGLGLAIIQMGGGIVFSLAGIIQAILIVTSSMHKLNRAEVFLIALLADAPDKKLDQKTLKSTFLRKGYAAKGDVELMFDRALDHLLELRIVKLQSPWICLAHTVVNLPELKTLPRPRKGAES